MTLFVSSEEVREEVLSDEDLGVYIHLYHVEDRLRLILVEWVLVSSTSIIDEQADIFFDLGVKSLVEFLHSFWAVKGLKVEFQNLGLYLELLLALGCHSFQLLSSSAEEH